MLYLVQYTWQPGTSAEETGRRWMDLHERNGGPPPDLTFRGWYELAGGGAGVFIVETEDPRHLNTAFLPWMDLISYDIRAVVESGYEQITTRIQDRMRQA